LAQLSELALDPSYSAGVRPARQAVLDMVLADLTGGSRVAYDRELRSRRGRGAAAGSPTVPLPPAQAVGALALLAESGEAAEDALTLARDLCECGALRSSALRDVRLSAALARADLARAAAARAETARACAELRAAAAELAAAPGSPALAPQLARACADSLAALLPAAALEQLAAPLGADAGPRREAALATLAPLLHGAESAPGAFAATDARTRLLPALTAAEAAALLDWADVARAGSGGRWAGVLRTGLRALLAAALTSREPRLARAAAAAARIAAAEAGAETAWAEEAAAAAMLLGEPDLALEHLSAAEAAGDADAMAAVRAASAAAAADEGGSPLPGLVAWAEAWLSASALDGFRDTAGGDARLAPYYDEPRVARELQGGAGSRALRALGGAFGWLGGKRGASPEAVPPAPPKALPAPAEEARPRRLTAAARAAAAVSVDKAPVAVTEVSVPVDARRPAWREVPPPPSPPAPAPARAAREMPPPPPPPPVVPRAPAPVMETEAAEADLSEVPATAVVRAPAPAADSDASKAPMSYAELMRRKQQQKAAGGASVPARPRIAMPAAGDDAAPVTLPAQRVRRPLVDTGVDADATPRALPVRPAAPAEAAGVGNDAIVFTAEQLSRGARARVMREAAEATIAASAAAEVAAAKPQAKAAEAVAPAPAAAAAAAAPVPAKPAAAWVAPPERERDATKRAAPAKTPRAPRTPPPPPPPAPVSAEASSAPAAGAGPAGVKQLLGSLRLVPKTALAVAAGAVALFFAARAVRLNAALPAPAPTAAVATSARQATPAPSQSQRHSGHARVSSAREAERVVRAWQRAKAAAMGTSHDADGLKTVLQGAMLDEWASRSGRARSAGFHWRYTLRRVTVDRLVGGSPPGAPAAAEVTLREAAELVDARTGRKRDSYDATYKVRYLMEDRGDGYRISRAAVLENTEH
jgi:hypothetical protein